VVINTNVSGRS